MMHVIKKQFGQRGDTIVEVLIAMAIISLVLAGAYVATRRNNASIQNSQEREQAQRLVESQIENVRSHNGIGSSGNCYNSSGTEVSGTSCKFNGLSGSGATYTMAVTGPAGISPSCSGTGCVYTITAVWTSLNAQSNDNSKLTMYYRLK